MAHALAFSHARRVAGRDRGAPARPGRSGGSWPSSSASTTISRSPFASARTPRWRSPRRSSPSLKERLHRLAGAVVGQPVPSRRGRSRRRPDRPRLGRRRLDRHDGRRMGRDWRRVLATLLRTDSFLDRLVSTGPLSEQDARDFGCVGPGRPRDPGSTSTRAATSPMTAIATSRSRRHVDGDAMARMEVRFQEVRRSLDLIRDAVASLAPGPTVANSARFVHDAALGRGRVGARGDALLARAGRRGRRWASASCARRRS